MLIQRRLLVPLAGLLFGAGLAVSAAAGEKVTVVELFTSQGCNACPPANALVLDLSQRPEAENLIVLSFHVNYWDYMGWKDTFATDVTTSRQYDYREAFGLRAVYTPQLIIDGITQMDGSKREAVMAGIEAARALGPAQIADPAVAVEAGVWSVKLPQADLDGAADVWVALYDRRQDVTMLAGENAGKTIAYSNIVRRFENLGTWTGDAADFPLPADWVDGRYDVCVVIVQMAGIGPIIGATRLHLASNR